jgi:hypothetical protein
MGRKPNPAFPAGIHHHQNNSFDEFRKRGYARAHHRRCGALRRRECVALGSFSFNISKKVRSREVEKLAPRQIPPERQHRPETSDLRLASGPAFLL